MPPERTSGGHFARQYQYGTVLNLVHDQTDKPFVTTRDVVEELGCSLNGAGRLLEALVDQGQLVSASAGPANAYFPPEWIPGRDQENVAFFPGRRELMLDDPGEHTREKVSRFGHLVDSSGDDYLYKIGNRDVWQAPYENVDELLGDLHSLTPERSPRLEEQIRRDWARAHALRLETHEDGYTVLRSSDPNIMGDVRDLSFPERVFHRHQSDTESRITKGRATLVKRTLYKAGYPVQDFRDLAEGSHLPMSLVDDITLRPYQEQWIRNFQKRRNGVYAAASGTGKTIAGIGTMCEFETETLIIVPSREVAAQWERELLETTTLTSRQVGQYHGGEKNVSPVTIATYTIVAMDRHFDLFNSREWGLIVYDECHHLPAEDWSTSADVQSRARLGLSATPVREAENSDAIYTLIGPPIGTDWEALFREGWVVKPDVEIQYVPWSSSYARDRYEAADGHEQRQAAATNPAKLDVVQSLVGDHHGQPTIIFVEWLDQGREYATRLDVPFLSGETPHDERERVLEAFRDGALDTLIMSRVGDEGIDLPNAEVVIIASSLGSSRAQHAQRVGRAMRPVGDAKAYVLATEGTTEMDFASHGMRYLDGKGVSVTETEAALPA